MSIGHGWGNSMTEDKNGTKATELLMFANEIRRNVVSHRMASAANATTPFQLKRSDPAGNTHGLAATKNAAATVTNTTRAWIRKRSRCPTELKSRSSSLADDLTVCKNRVGPENKRYQPTVPFAKNNFAIDVNRTASSWVNIERHLPHGTYE
jgi:hypothetical protein